MGGSKTLVIDIDGVLTDGKMYIDGNGKKMFKAFHSKDIRAIREFVANGYRVVLVTADDWPGGVHFAENCGCEIIVLRDKSKLAIPEYILVCDSVWDTPMIERATHVYCPADVHFHMYDRWHQATGKNVMPLKTGGGMGVIDELVYLVLEQYKIADIA